MVMIYILLTKIIAVQNEVSLSYHRVRGLYFIAVVFVATEVYPTVRNKAIHAEMHIL